MSNQPLEYIKHIADECAYLLSISQGLSQEAFLSDETLKRAVVRSLEVIGEATKQVPADYRESYPIIQWKSMAGMRDRLIHDYMGVNYLIVGTLLTNKIPELKRQIFEIVEQDKLS